ncbi:MAG TPA: prepilin-type N-terminal cleavage/methylation domain-containing protein [Blastocatellia bacterium]|nr:prepilin-type N-terminal cleavage/methylation domain-containing protein [Blastocatellia bacterium]
MNRDKAKHTATNESGMSLIEVMVSLVVLGVVLVGLAQGLIYGIKVNSESKMKVANLNMCKYLTENLKTQISQSQAVFDGTAASSSTYYVDTNGNRTTTTSGSQQTDAYVSGTATSSSAFRVNVVVTDGGLTQTVNGVSKVLVKVLDVTVVDVQNRDKVGRSVEMRVEIIRPTT